MRRLTINEITNLYNEYQKKPHYGTRCGIKALDEILRMERKSLAVLTSRQNDGKSTFLNYYTYMMGVNNGWKTLYFNFETDNGRFINDLVKLYGSIESVATYARIAKTDSLKNLDDLYQMILETKEKQGVDIVVIDPIMRLNGWLSEINTYTIGQILTDLQQMAKANDLLVIIAAHPTKLKDGEPINPNDIMGSTYFYTVSDFIFSLTITDRENMITELKTLKIRNNLDMGVCGKSCYLSFDPFTKHYEGLSNNLGLPFGKSDTEQTEISICEEKAEKTIP